MEQTTRVSPEVLVARARTLVPLQAERAAQAEAELKLAVDEIAALQEAQLFRVMQPKRHGGLEFGPKVLAEIQKTLAEGCMPTAWMYGVLAVHPWQRALGLLHRLRALRVVFLGGNLTPGAGKGNSYRSFLLMPIVPAALPAWR